MSDNPFNDNPFAVGTSVTQQDSASPSPGAWGTATGQGSAWGTAAGSARQNEEPLQAHSYSGAVDTAPTPSTLPLSMGFGGGASSFNNTSNGVGGKSGNKERDLDKREAELNRREAELKRLETELRNSGVTLKRKNWPKFCSIVHHDINADIPENLRWTIRSAYYAYVGLVCCLVWNFIGCCGAWIVKGSIAAFLWGSLYVVGGVPGAWFLWYRRLYRASIKDSAFGYGLFFLFFASAHLIFTAWSAVAPPIINSWSHVGFWVGAQEVQGESGALAVLYYIGGGFWSIEFLWSFWTLKKVYWAFRGAGHSANSVRNDAARTAVASSV
jgi:hypothetical protein